MKKRSSARRKPKSSRQIEYAALPYRARHVHAEYQKCHEIKKCRPSNRINDDVAGGRRPCQPRAGTCDHAGRQRRDHTDRPGAVIQYFRGRACVVHCRAGHIPCRNSGSTRALGRIAIGLGLTLLALHILVDTLAPAEEAPLVRSLLAAITHDPVLCVVIAAALTWAAHSSVAVVLLIMSLAYSHFVSAEAALALVVGANLGSAINPLVEGASRADPANRRLPLGNLVNRLVGVLIILPLLPFSSFDATCSLVQRRWGKIWSKF